MTANVTKLLYQWLNSRLDSASYTWINSRVQSIKAGTLKDLYLGFGLVARKIPKAELQLLPQEIAEANLVRPSWQPEFWSLQDAARTLMLLEYTPDSPEQFVSVSDRLFATGEVHELVALYQSLAVLPFAEHHVERAAEGIRTNMQPVFKAVAHYNPYPAEQLEEGMWNQMVLKCLFIGTTLHPVIGLDDRINAALSQMLCDYAHERWAASRDVHPELWRCVRPEFTPGAIEDLKRVIQQGSTLEQKAAALCLASSSMPEARELLETVPQLHQQIEEKKLCWSDLHGALIKEKP